MVVVLFEGGIVGANARIEDELMPQKNCEAKDEMNLAEFPLCALAHRLKPEVKTLRFEDRTWDKGRNEWVTRQLTITGSDAYGLPTEKDDEILLGLIQITRLQGFADRKVPFTRHELIRILGWRDDSKSYARVEDSLNRWTGVTLYWNKAWWNKDRQRWMDEKFHILDNVWLCHRGDPAPDTGLPTTGAPLSAFVWNEVIFRSFTHGNLKSIDFEFFKSLKSAVAKRLYRFLDKRFYHRSCCEVDLRELACEKVGLSRKYDAAGLKRKLLSGARELEERGFLCPIPPSEQFRRVRRGEWRVVFRRSEGIEHRTPSVQDDHESPMVRALIQRGVTAAAAQRAVEAFPAERIYTNLEVFDWLAQRKDNKVSRNPAGFLMSSITHDYAPPRGFAPSASERPKFTRTQGAKRVATGQRAKTNQDEKERQSQEFARFWSSLSEEERKQTESRAMVEANKLQKKLLEGGGTFAETARKAILEAYVFKSLRRPTPRATE
jgi:hypothetical protein